MTTIDKHTSYEIDCATARTAPNIEYLLLLLHPAPRITYTPTAEIQKKNIAEYLKIKTSNVVGYMDQRAKGIINAKQGTI